MKNVLVCGVGAIGSNLATYLASDVRGEHEITILDRDVVEERNIIASTQNFFREQIGLPKTEALQYILHKMNRKIEIIDGDITKMETDVALSEYNLVVDCFDNHEARETIQDWWKALKFSRPNKLPCPDVLHCGFSDKFTFAIEWAENYTVPEDNPKARDLCELPGASSFVHMVATIGSSVIQEYLTTGKQREFVGNKFSVQEVK